jgi:hypothetical protein
MGDRIVNAVQQLADVISFPARSVGNQAASVASSAARTVSVWTANEVDDWGRDNGFVDRVWSTSRLRWNVSVGGIDHVPKRAGGLIVVNARRFALAPIFAALAIGAETDRPVRFVGRPDIAPLGPVMQRLGGLLPIPREVEVALRAGELVVLGADHETTNRHAGHIDHKIVGAATMARVRAIPAATVSVPLRRSARVEIGAPIRLSKRRRGPLDELETADALQRHIDELLDELGGALTGTPLDWLPFGGIGGL